ncbi:hypothetical protein DFP72DRAFT_845809 [Ephemerocybe angulata]|uniref:Uncharacterized protein n=1 Tax=Ephemerocybe angulata TaxID=980116 RepID=A0A8H6I232_9AGAR|nr:hypothetical protein DFP72DRAFT_845809 [Tulosesus angulatus]
MSPLRLSKKWRVAVGTGARNGPTPYLSDNAITRARNEHFHLGTYGIAASRMRTRVGTRGTMLLATVRCEKDKREGRRSGQGLASLSRRLAALRYGKALKSVSQDSPGFLLPSEALRRARGRGYFRLILARWAGDQDIRGESLLGGLNGSSMCWTGSLVIVHAREKAESLDISSRQSPRWHKLPMHIHFIGCFKPVQCYLASEKLCLQWQAHYNSRALGANSRRLLTEPIDDSRDFEQKTGYSFVTVA